MTETYTSIKQSLINKINAKQDFNYAKDPKAQVGRYTVSMQTLHKSFNPSIYFMDCYSSIDNALTQLDLHVTSLGGWLDQNTGIYYVDLCVRYDSLELATKIAENRGEIAIYDNKTDSLIHI